MYDKFVLLPALFITFVYSDDLTCLLCTGSLLSSSTVQPTPSDRRAVRIQRTAA